MTHDPVTCAKPCVECWRIIQERKPPKTHSWRDFFPPTNGVEAEWKSKSDT